MHHDPTRAIYGRPAVGGGKCCSGAGVVKSGATASIIPRVDLMSKIRNDSNMARSTRGRCC